MKCLGKLSVVFCGLLAAAAMAAPAAQAANHTLSLTNHGMGQGSFECSENDAAFTACAGSYPDGIKLVIRPVPAQGSAFHGWATGGNPAAGCSEILGNGDCVISSFTQDTILYADIEISYVTLSVRVAGGGNGTVTCNGAPCANVNLQYPVGTAVTIVASPGVGSVFLNFSEDCSGTQPTCTVTMDRNRSVGATFAQAAPPPGSLPGVPKVWEFFGEHKHYLFEYKSGKVEVPVQCYGETTCRGAAGLYAELAGDSRKGGKGKGKGRNGKGRGKGKGQAGQHKHQRRSPQGVLLDKEQFSIESSQIGFVIFKITEPRARKQLEKGQTLVATVKGGGIDPTRVRIKE